uniref:DekiORF132 n=1 Tax=Dendrolimus kikuchii nucleopolyhedrovirus TaxID=1219875 RepID=V9LSW9_9ABAC|nr:DekiORF132 [Dendrolimus kikuchii nucleopolyhedrovirus]
MVAGAGGAVAARLDRANAQTRQNLLSLLAAAGSQRSFYEMATACLYTILFNENYEQLHLCKLVIALINLERNVFGKSLLLNGLTNFLIANSDGATLQHTILANVLSVILNTYY